MNSVKHRITKGKRTFSQLISFALGVAALGSQPVMAEKQTIPFKDARIKFEVNATDSDAGI